MFIRKSLKVLPLVAPLPLLIPPVDAISEITIIAHRGNSSIAPENTLASFRSAADHNFPFIELDVHLTKDGVPIVVHDRYLTHKASIRFPMTIDSMTLNHAKQIDCGKWFDRTFAGETMPTLEELLNAPLNNIGVMVEIKEGSAPDEVLAKAVLNIVKKHPNRQILVGSISPHIVHAIRDLSPETTTIGIAETHYELLEHLHNHPEYIALNREFTTPLLVRHLRLRGYKVWVWTVDEPQEMEYMIHSQVDGIITNKPALLQSLKIKRALTRSQSPRG